MSKRTRNRLLAAGAALTPYVMAGAALAWAPPTTPIADFTPCELVDTLIDILFGLAAAVALVFIIIGGYQYMTAGGDKMALEGARGRITSAVVGIIIALGAWAIMQLVVVNFLNASIPACVNP
jgi:type IV secretory pathway VirB2 component (pilin)